MLYVLAQATSSAETTGVWAAVTVLLSSLTVSIGKLLSDWKTNRNQENTLTEIKDISREQNNHIMNLAAKLEKQEGVRDAQHEANLREMTNLCKAQFYFKHRQIIEPQKPKHENE